MNDRLEQLQLGWKSEKYIKIIKRDIRAWSQPLIAKPQFFSSHAMVRDYNPQTSHLRGLGEGMWRISSNFSLSLWNSL